MKKLWYYQRGDDKRNASLTELRDLVKKSKDDVSITIEKLDSNWFVEWSGSILIRNVCSETEI